MRHNVSKAFYFIPILLYVCLNAAGCLMVMVVVIVEVEVEVERRGWVRRLW